MPCTSTARCRAEDGAFEQRIGSCAETSGEGLYSGLAVAGSLQAGVKVAKAQPVHKVVRVFTLDADPTSGKNGAHWRRACRAWGLTAPRSRCSP